jgi:hypothetical protein
MGTLWIGSPVLLLCWLILIPIMQETAIHPADVTDRWLTLKHISPAFAEAVREHRENLDFQERQENYDLGYRAHR